MIIKNSSRYIWVPATFVRYAYLFEGAFFDFRKYYLQALESDSQRWS